VFGSSALAIADVRHAADVASLKDVSRISTDGRTRAQTRGVRFGRKHKLSQFQVAQAIRRRDAGEAMADINRFYGVSHSTISRL
jgi:hypothetical protein